MSRANCCKPLDDAVTQFQREWPENATLELTFTGSHYQAIVDLPVGRLEFESQGDDWGEMIADLLDKVRD